MIENIWNDEDIVDEFINEIVLDGTNVEVGDHIEYALLGFSSNRQKGRVARIRHYVVPSGYNGIDFLGRTEGYTVVLDDPVLVDCGTAVPLKVTSWASARFKDVSVLSREEQ